MKISKPTLVDIGMWLFLFLLIGCMLLALAGCNFMRKLDKSETHKDSITASSIDSNWLKKVSENNAYQKGSGQEIRIYGRDTTINHFSTPINNYYPAQGDNSGQLLAVLTSWQHEQGSSQKIATDSGAMAKKDSSSVSLDEKTKQTETSAKPPWYVWALAAAVVYLLVKQYLPKIKIVK